MSKLANTTERQVIKELAKTLNTFSRLSSLNMTHEDDLAVRSAENSIRSVIESNGYAIAYKPGKGFVTKQLPQQG
jgi:hypothetical protein